MHQDSHDGGEPERVRACSRRPGRPNGLVEKSYRLLFFDFFAPFFFVDFLAFLAAIKWLLRVRRPVVRPLLAPGRRLRSERFVALCRVEPIVSRRNRQATSCRVTALTASLREFNQLGQCFVKVNWQT
jgi:hypothetical protein